MNARLVSCLLFVVTLAYSVPQSGLSFVLNRPILSTQTASSKITSLTDIFNVSSILDSCIDANTFNETILNSVINSPFFLEYDAIIYIIRSSNAKNINETRTEAQNMITGDIWSMVSEFGEQYWASKCDSVNRAIQMVAKEQADNWLKSVNVSTLVNKWRGRNVRNDLKSSLREALQKVPVPSAIEKMDQIVAKARALADQSPVGNRETSNTMKPQSASKIVPKVSATIPPYLPFSFNK